MTRYTRSELFRGALIGMLTTFAVIYVYQNVIIPWPDREQLRQCLEEAQLAENLAARETTENICYRNHGHIYQAAIFAALRW